MLYGFDRAYYCHRSFAAFRGGRAFSSPAFSVDAHQVLVSSQTPRDVICLQLIQQMSPQNKLPTNAGKFN